MTENVLIIFSREPKEGNTKTRMMPYLSEAECVDLHMAFLKDLNTTINNLNKTKQSFDTIIFFAGENPSDNVRLKSVFGESLEYKMQDGSDLGEKMHNAIEYSLAIGYKKAVLIGTDIPSINEKTLEKAFNKLSNKDVVIGPTIDGGYYLIGLKKPCKEIFDIDKFGNSSVFEKTCNKIGEKGLSFCSVDAYNDIDNKDDLAIFRSDMRKNKRLRESFTGEFIKKNTKLSVIIPIYNEILKIDKLVNSLMPYKNRAEIIFTDGGSTDGTLDCIPGCFKVLNCSKGRANQMNEGVIYSSGDIILFLHADSEFPKDFIDEVFEVMETHDYGCFGIRFNSKNFFMYTNQVISNHRAFSRGLPFGDQGIFIDRELFEKVGGFPNLPIMEDYEFGKRLKKLGYYPGKTTKRIVTSDRRYSKSTRKILRTQYEMFKLRRLYNHGVSIDEIARRYKDIR